MGRALRFLAKQGSEKRRQRLVSLERRQGTLNELAASVAKLP
jgi:hypothetical protein